MKKPVVRELRCAVYTRKSSEEGLEQEFNSLDAQREACEAYIASQKPEGWVLVPDRYDDGGISGATLERPALQRLLADIESRRVDVVVVYKIDRLSCALMDFAKLLEVFDRNNVTFVSVTQSFNTTTSMGRLTLNILLSFAQFEREVIGERIRDKFAASRKKGMWMGGEHPGADFGAAERSDLRSDWPSDDTGAHPQGRQAISLLCLDRRADANACPVRRIPAAEIESAVVDQLRCLLRAPEIIVGTWRAARQSMDDINEADVRDALYRLDPLWDELFPAEQARIVHLLIERVDINTEGADIRLRTEGLTTLVVDLRAVEPETRRAA